MSIKNYLKKYLPYQTGLVNEDQAIEDYYKQYLYTDSTSTLQPVPNTGTNIPSVTTTTGSSLSSQQLQNLYQTMKTSTVTSGFSGYGNPWSEADKEALAKMEMTYDEKTNNWNLRLSIDIKIPQNEGMLAFISSDHHGKPMDMLIERLKNAKKMLVEKLTAKIILAELIKPREIKQ